MNNIECPYIAKYEKYWAIDYFPFCNIYYNKVDRHFMILSEKEIKYSLLFDSLKQNIIPARPLPWMQELLDEMDLEEE